MKTPAFWYGTVSSNDDTFARINIHMYLHVAVEWGESAYRHEILAASNSKLDVC